MELQPLRVFLTVAAEKSFSRAGEKLLRTQPAISLAIQRLETELGEKLIDRSAKDLILTDAGKITERFRRVNYGRLEIEITVDDPKAYTKPWTITLNELLAPDTDLLDYICLENEKDRAHMVVK